MTRQCYALFFFAVLIMAATSTRIAPRSARIVIAVTGVGIAVTHYSSAYLAACAVISAWILCLVFRMPRTQRAVTGLVAGVVASATLLWGLLVARTEATCTEIISSIRADGSAPPGQRQPVVQVAQWGQVSRLVDSA